MPTKKKTAGNLRTEQSEGSLEEYEKGLRLLQQRDYAKAIPRFEAVLAQVPAEPALCDRARVYLRIARKENEARLPLRTTRVPEQSFEVGVFLLNEGEYKEAARQLERAAEHAPQDATILISLAAARLHGGDEEGCLATLRQAIEIDPKIRIALRTSSDFEPLHDNDDFDRLAHDLSE